MSRSLSQTLLFLVVSVLGLFVLLLGYRRPQSEAMYRGKPLRVWLDDTYPTTAGPVLLSASSIQAVRSIGDPAIPTLLSWLRSPDPAVNRVAFRLNCKLRYTPFRLPFDHCANQRRAMYGFRALGQVAKDAFPAIVEVALFSDDEEIRSYAINSLTEADADTERLFVAALNAPNQETRARAAFALGCLQLAPETSVPALTEALRDPSLDVRNKVAGAIRMYNQAHQNRTSAQPSNGLELVDEPESYGESRSPTH